MTTPNPANHESGHVLRPQARRSARAREAPPRTVCQVVPLKDEQGFALALVRVLDRSIPEVHFRVGGAGEPDWLWICGVEPADFERIARLRHDLTARAHEAPRRPKLLVTGRNLSPGWRDELVRAGVDLALEWPCSVERLRERLVQPG